MSDLTLNKILSAVEMCKAHDKRTVDFQLTNPWWQYELAFIQVRVLEKAGQDINPILDVYGGNIRELYQQWKQEVQA